MALITICPMGLPAKRTFLLLPFFSLLSPSYRSFLIVFFLTRVFLEKNEDLVCLRVGRVGVSLLHMFFSAQSPGGPLLIAFPLVTSFLFFLANRPCMAFHYWLPPIRRPVFMCRAFSFGSVGLCSVCKFPEFRATVSLQLAGIFFFRAFLSKGKECSVSFVPPIVSVQSCLFHLCVHRPSQLFS